MAPASTARASEQLAVEKGLIAADALLTDEEIDNLIFLPGFSTASTVSEHFRARRRHGRGQTLDPGARRAHLDRLAAGPRLDLHA